ncbi:hypothetical protein DL96DRAFT_1715768 [Flagelloscypha sp. PMI_526]|nr:hypothetical protein DL96DRAFT_1715768 [Flagelloscypha sp. PMI_526]
MRQFQSKDRKSLFGPRAPRTRTAQLPGTAGPSASKLDTSLNAAGIALQLARDAGEAASNVPYVKAVAGVLSQIIKIREDIQSNRERCHAIIDLVKLKSTTVLQCLDTVYRVDGVEGLEDLRSDLEAYADFLTVVLRDQLEPWKKRSRWSSYVNRGKHAEDLHKLERELEEFGNRFFVKRQVAISLDARAAVTLLSKPLPSPEIIPQALPASPEVVIGRESVIESVVQAIVSSPEPRIAVLGQGGVGKTTVTTAVLHNSRVAAMYLTRYFVSCERAPTTDLLLSQIADALSIPQASRSGNLSSLIVHHIRNDTHSVLLYIDNLETVWEVDAEQANVNHFLEVLSGVGSKLAVLITMRGLQEPKTSFLWNPTVLTGLSKHDSATMYETLSGNLVDPSAHVLLSKLSGSPLAIKLFALMVKEGDSPSQLLSSWDEHGTKALEIGGTHRLSNLNQSIHLSIFSPRIDDVARLVLELIALMPDGLSASPPWFEGFASVLPDRSLLHPALRTLRRAALLEQNGEPPRWQMLPPIQQFCLQLINPASPAVASLVELYVTKVTEHWTYTTSASHAIILPEMTNIRELLLYGSSLQPFPSLIGEASEEYASWANWQGIDESVFLSSFLRLAVPARHLAYIHRRIGIMHLRWDRLDAAEASFALSLKLFTEAESRWGQADTHAAIGNLELRRERLDAADLSLLCALRLYIQLHSRLGEANTRRSIGDLHVCREELDAAEASFSLALNLYVQAEYQWGEANSHESLGGLYLRRGQLEAAEVSFNHALRLFTEVQHHRGEANTRKSLGNIYLRRYRPDAAKESFTLALQSFTKIQDRQETAACNFLLGQTFLRSRELDMAADAFSQALTLWETIGDYLCIAQTHQAIGDLYLQRNQLDKADVSLNLALDIYTTKVRSVRDEVLTRDSIKKVQLRQLKDGEEAFQYNLNEESLQYRSDKPFQHDSRHDIPRTAPHMHPRHIPSMSYNPAKRFSYHSNLSPNLSSRFVEKAQSPPFVNILPSISPDFDRTKRSSWPPR